MIDTNKAREMRAKGTPGKWGHGTGWEQTTPGVYLYSKPPGHGHVLYAPSDDDDTTYGENISEADAQLIAHAVNALEPMADEIDRLRRMYAGLRMSIDMLSDEQCNAEFIRGVLSAFPPLGDSNG